MTSTESLASIQAGLSTLLARSGVKPVAVGIDVAAWMISMGPSSFKKLIKKREIDSFLVGQRRRLVRVAEIERWAESRASPVVVRYPKSRGKGEGDKIRAALKKKPGR